MSFVDLHAHSIFSDGIDTPAELVKLAAENKVAVLGVADHDNLNGLKEALAAGVEHGVTVVRGVEITTGFHGRTIHILGYGVPLDNIEFNDFLNRLYLHRKTTILDSIKKLNIGFVAAGRPPVDVDDFIASQGTYFNTARTAEYLTINGYFQNLEAAAKSLFELKDEGEHLVSSADAIAAVHKAGGIAIVAHPLARGTSLVKLDPTPAGQEELLKELIASGIDGLECYQSEYGPEETAFAMSLAAKYDLLVSAGSDWHGALCDVGWDIKGLKSYYPEHIGGLGVTASQVAPLLERLGVGK